MANDPKSGKDLDVMALLHEVHGSHDGARTHAVDTAVHALERTHRQASMAMRHFEQHGRGPRSETRELDPLLAELPSSPAPPAAPAAAPPPSPTVEEVTALWRPQLEATQLGRPQATAQLPAPRSTERTQIGREEAKKVSPNRDQEAHVYGGQGAQLSFKERTQTKIVPRGKK